MNNIFTCIFSIFRLKFLANKFEISDYDYSQESDFYETMRGEITRAYLYDRIQNETSVLNSYFKCDHFYKLKSSNETNFHFDWSNVLMTSFLNEFKKRESNFCTSLGFFFFNDIFYSMTEF